MLYNYIREIIFVRFPQMKYFTMKNFYNENKVNYGISITFMCHSKKMTHSQRIYTQPNLHTAKEFSGRRDMALPNTKWVSVTRL